MTKPDINPNPQKIESMVAVIKTLIQACKITACIHCPRSFGTNINKLQCQFKIKPREITRENYSEFISSWVDVERLAK